MRKGRDQSKFGIAIYRPEDWARLREIADDRDNLEESWTEWSRGIATLEHEQSAAGKAYQTILVDLDQLIHYCRDRGMRNDAAARARFVSDLLRHEHRNQGPTIDDG